MNLKLHLPALAIALSCATSLFSQNFHPFEDGLKPQGAVYALDYESALDRVVIGGDFDQVGGTNASNIALYENGAWKALGPGLNGQVNAIKCVQNTVYATGRFTAAGDKKVNGIALWDGQAWQALGSGVNNNSTGVSGLEWFQGKLWVSGTISRAGSVAVNNLAVWDGAGWADGALPSGINPAGLKAFGDSLFVWGSGPGNKGALQFSTGTGWNLLAALPADVNKVVGLDVYNEQITIATQHNIYRLQANNWVPVYGTIKEISGLCRQQGDIYFLEGDSRYELNNLKQLDAQGMTIAAGVAKDGYVQTIVRAGSNIWAAGDFKQMNNQVSIGLAQYDGAQWQSPGSVSSSSNYSNTSTYGFCLFPDTSGQVYVGGEFVFAGNVLSPGIAKWDGANWHAVGNGFNARVRKILRYKGELYAFGSFTKSGAQDCKYAAHWTGTIWEQIGPNASGFSGIVRDAVEWNGKLYMAGEFILPGNKHQCMAEFDGINWNGIGPELNAYDVIYKLTLFNTKLYACIASYGVLQFSTSTDWVNVDGPWKILDLKEYNGALYAAALGSGAFRYTPGQGWEDLHAPLDQYSQQECWRFFSIRGDLFLMIYGKGLYRKDGNSWSFVDGSSITDVTALTDERFLVVGFLKGFYEQGNYKKLEGIAELVFEPVAPVVTDLTPDTICKQQYTFLRAESSSVDAVTYTWDLPGSAADTLVRRVAVTRYPESGVFSRNLLTENSLSAINTPISPLYVSDACPLSPGPKPDNIWLMPYNNTEGYMPFIDFRYDKPGRGGIYVPENAAPYAANASACDDEGNLVLYANGMDVWNAKGQRIKDSDSIPDYFADGAQNMLLLPFPQHPGVYYRFYAKSELLDIDPDSGGIYISLPLKLRYDIVDIHAASGAGAFLAKNQTAVSDKLMTGTLQAVRHANGKDWWIIVHKYTSDYFYCLLLTENGISAVSPQFSEYYLYGGHGGQTAFSPDGTWLGMVNNINNTAYLWRFDRCTGAFSAVTRMVLSTGGVYIQANESVYGCSFSPDGTRFYVNSNRSLYQFDLQSNDIENSGQWIADVEGNVDYTTFARQLVAPNGHIYVSGGEGYLHDIRQPNVLGTGCDFKQNALFIGTNNYTLLPNYPNLRLGPLGQGNCQTSGISGDLALPAVFPSPATDAFTISFQLQTPLDEMFTVEIFNLAGQLLRSEQRQFLSPQSFEVNKLPKGMYLVRLQGTEHRFVVKLVVGG